MKFPLTWDLVEIKIGYTPNYGVKAHEIGALDDRRNDSEGPGMRVRKRSSAPCKAPSFESRSDKFGLGTCDGHAINQVFQGIEAGIRVHVVTLETGH